jgi:uroporphyrinogen decarboxylase
MELFHDESSEQAIGERLGLLDGLDATAADYIPQRRIRVYRALGFDYIPVRMGPPWSLRFDKIADTEGRPGSRSFLNEHVGPITNWKEFEEYNWPKPDGPETIEPLKWFSKNVPDDMCLVVPGQGHYCEFLCWLMGYESFCFALYEQRDLVEALYAKLHGYFQAMLKCVLQFERVKVIFGSDDMGFKTGLMFSPADMRRYVLSGHKQLVEMTHAAGRIYALHACGNLVDIMDDLIDDVKIDAKHSFEDTILDVRDAKARFGRRVSLVGGIDVDFLCRQDEAAIRRRVRETLDVCMPGGGYCLGTGNSVANYIPVDHYLAMVDEGRLWGA